MVRDDGRMERASLPEAGEPTAPCALAPGRDSGGVLPWAEGVAGLAAVGISRRAWFPGWFQAKGVLAHRIVATRTRCHRGISMRVEVESAKRDWDWRKVLGAGGAWRGNGFRATGVIQAQVETPR